MKNSLKVLFIMFFSGSMWLGCDPHGKSSGGSGSPPIGEAPAPGKEPTPGQPSEPNQGPGSPQAPNPGAPQRCQINLNKKSPALIAGSAYLEFKRCQLSEEEFEIILENEK